MPSRSANSSRVAARYALLKNAGPLTDVSKLRHQAIFMMGAGGSGKGYVSSIWLKYGPGGTDQKVKKPYSEKERLLSDLNFENAKKRLEAKGIRIQISEDGSAKIPFRLYSYDHKGGEIEIKPEEWEEELPPKIFREVKEMKDIIFSTPKHELPSYWRQVNPDLFKEELPGYDPDEPGYVHEMSSDMSKAYLETALETGDPIFVDGTGSSLQKMSEQMNLARSYGYRISLVLVSVPLIVNQIRNATRPRKVNPREITRQWMNIQANYVKLRSLADVSKVILNRNDATDIAKFRKNEEAINAFILKSTQSKYPDLYSYAAEVAPNEISHWGPILKGGHGLEKVVQENDEASSRRKRIEELRKKYDSIKS